MAESSSYSLVHRILEIVNVITSIGDFKTHKKECNILTRRVKLLVPIFEEARDMRLSFSGEGLKCIDALEAALTTAKVLLLLCNKGSKLFLVTFRLFKHSVGQSVVLCTFSFCSWFSLCFLTC